MASPVSIGGGRLPTPGLHVPGSFLGWPGGGDVEALEVQGSDLVAPFVRGVGRGVRRRLARRSAGVFPVDQGQAGDADDIPRLKGVLMNELPVDPRPGRGIQIAQNKAAALKTDFGVAPGDVRVCQ